MVLSKINKNKDSNLGLRLVKLLLYRLYSMLSVNPLKWYEIIIAVVMGAFLGLGIGSMAGSLIKLHIILSGVKP